MLKRHRMEPYLPALAMTCLNPTFMKTLDVVGLVFCDLYLLDAVEVLDVTDD